MGLLDSEITGIERTFDSAAVNVVSNHPSIFPAICGGREGPVDWSDHVEDRRNVFLAGEFGLAIFDLVQDGAYEMHIRVLPPGRGKWSIGFAIASIAWMFQRPWVKVLVCRVPRGNYACRALLRRCGCAQFETTLAEGWLDEIGRPIEADAYSLTRERWIRMNCDA
jgi:RimJ/RimL family protein N-acetyltransferase